MAIDRLTKTLLRNSNSPGFCWHFVKHLLSSPTPCVTPCSISAIVRILAEASMLSELDHLHQLLLSFPPSDNSRLCLAALSFSSAKARLIDVAISQFHSLRSRFPSQHPSVHLYNVLLQSSLKENRSDLISFLYKDMIISKIPPDTYTFNILIASLCDLGCLDDARKLFDRMHIKACKPNMFTYGILCRGYCKVGLSCQALELLNLMAGSGCSPNRVIYNTLIAGFCKEGRVDEAESLLERMRSEGLLPNAVTFNSRISALCKAGNVLGAAEILRDMEMGDGVELPRPNCITYNLVLDGFCKVQMMGEAGNLVKSMKENGIFSKLESYNVWLSGLVRSGKLLEARSLLEEMTESDIKPKICSYNILIDGLCKGGMTSDARSLMSLMRSKGVIPDVVTYSSLLNRSCSKGKVTEANRILEEMVQNGCVLNTVTCNILLQSLWKQGKVLEAEKLLQKMTERGYELDTVTCNTVINGLCSSGKLEKAIDIVDGMWDHGSVALGDLGHAFLGLVDNSKSRNKCSPDLVSYSTIINGLCKAGRFDEAKKKFVEMKGRKLGADSVVYDIFIHGFSKHGKLSSAFRVLRDMEKSCNLSTKSYNLLIQELSRKNRITEINDLINEMQIKGVVLDVFTYNNLINCLCENEKAQEAALLLNEMLQQGVIPNLSSFCLLIRGFCKVCDFVAAREVFDISLTILGQKDPLYGAMFNELLRGGEILKARELLEASLDRGVGLKDFSYKNFIQELCREDGLEDSIRILNEMINRDYIFDPATFMPVIHELGRNGRKHEGDKLSESMMEMAARCEELSRLPRHLWEGKTMMYVKLPEYYSDRASNFKRRKKDDISVPDWHTILHRDDGSALAIKVLRRVQRGWGQGSLLNLKALKNDILV